MEEQDYVEHRTAQLVAREVGRIARSQQRVTRAKHDETTAMARLEHAARDRERQEKNIDDSRRFLRSVFRLSDEDVDRLVAEVPARGKRRLDEEDEDDD